MQRKYGFLIMITGLSLLIAMGVHAQTNAPTCPTLVQESFTATEFLCETVEDGQACIGNGTVSTTPVDGATVQFANPGEFATITDIQRLQLESVNTDTQAWTSVVGKLDATTPDGEPEIIDMLVFGDAIISSTLEGESATPSTTVFPATIEAAGGVIVRQQPDANSNNIWQLTNNETVEAIGRSRDNQWVRIIIPSPNGGAGWVFGQFINVSIGRELLPFQTNDFPVPESSNTGSSVSASLKPMQAFRLESLPTDSSCSDTPDSGVILQSASPDQRALVEVNGVELRFRGTVFLTAQVNDKMTIYNVEGEARSIIGETRVNMTPSTVSEVPMDASLAPTADPTEPVALTQEQVDRLQSLPVRLLSRNFDIIVVDSVPVEFDTQADEQTAPAATEVPIIEDLPEDVECPSLVQESYTATEFLCENLGPNQACIGNASPNMVTAVARDGAENFSFASPSDKVNSTDIETLTTRVFDEDNPENIWNSIMMTVDTNTTGGATAQATLLIIGEVDLDNEGVDPDEIQDTADTDEQVSEPPAETESETIEDTSTESTTPAEGIPAVIEAPGGIIVRSSPRVDTDTVGQLQDGDAVTALGRSVDQQWVQIQSETGVSGWVFVQFVAVEGGAEALPIIDPSVSQQPAPPPPASSDGATQQTAPPPAINTAGQPSDFTSMQAFNFESQGVPSACTNTPSGGIIIQSPDGMTDGMLMLINNVTFQINGTTYLRAERNENMNIIGLEGDIIVTAGGTSQTVLAGQQSTIELENGLEPAGVPSIPGDYSFDTAEQFPQLPVRLLSRSFEVIVPPAPDGATVVENNADSSDDDSGDGVNIGGTTVDFDASCEISAGDERRNIRAGAGLEFDVSAVIQPGQTVSAVSQQRGSDRYYWYETSQGWIRQDVGIPSAECENLPLFGVIYATSGNGDTVVVESAAPVAPPPPAQPTAPPPPPVASEGFGNVCESGNFSSTAELEESGRNYVEFGGVWTGVEGQSVTFSADVQYFRPELQNILTFVNEDGSAWLGSLDGTVFTINFDTNRRFRVRVGALLGDIVTLRVNCG